MDKTYSIEKIEDIFSIPKERRDQFYIELKTFINKAEALKLELAQFPNNRLKNIKMIWCDDGIDEVNSISITMPNGDKITVS